MSRTTYLCIYFINISKWTSCHERWNKENVWTSDKSWESGTLCHSHTLSLFHSFTLSFTHSWHAEQLLFSCLCSKITLSLSHSHTLALSHSHTFTLFQCLIQSLSTCWTSFVFMSRLKSHCLLPKIAMLFFGPQPQPTSLGVIELVPS